MVIITNPVFVVLTLAVKIFLVMYLTIGAMSVTLEIGSGGPEAVRRVVIKLVPVDNNGFSQ